MSSALRALVTRLRRRRRVPSGPLTTAEQATADARKTSTNGGGRAAHDHDTEAG